MKISVFTGRVFYQKNDGQIFECFVSQAMVKIDKELLYDLVFNNKERISYMMFTENEIELFKNSLNNKQLLEYLNNPSYQLENYHMFGIINDEEYTELKNKIVNGK